MELADVVEGYWEHYSNARSSDPDQPGWWAWEVVERTTHGQVGALPDDPLDLVEALAAAAPSSAALAYLGAGPVEDLLRRPDARLVDRMDRLAERDNQFRLALACANVPEDATTSDGKPLNRWRACADRSTSSE